MLLLMGVIGLLAISLAPAYSDTYCSFRVPQDESVKSWTQGPSWWPFGTRCTYDLPDGTTVVVGPGLASSILSPVLVALYVVTVGVGLLAPPTRFWRRATWVLLAPVLPLGLALLSGFLPAPLDGLLFLVALGVGVGLVFAVLTAVIVYGLHPQERWWIFPGAWLGWSITLTVGAVTLWVLA
jgi:hypothetical protein